MKIEVQDQSPSAESRDRTNDLQTDVAIENVHSLTDQGTEPSEWAKKVKALFQPHVKGTRINPGALEALLKQASGL